MSIDSDFIFIQLKCSRFNFHFRLESNSGRILVEMVKEKPENSGRLYGENASVWKLLRKERKPFEFLADPFGMHGKGQPVPIARETTRRASVAQM